MTTHEPTPATSSGVTRRRVVKAGAHAAWVVPTVAVVASAPAFADSVRSSLSVINIATARRVNQPTRLNISGDIANQAGVDATGVQVVVSFSTILTYGSSNNPNFALAGGSPTVGSSFTFLATTDISGTSPGTLGLDLDFTGFATSSTLTGTIAPSATNDNGTSTNASFTAS